jgi:hypothetical protein
VIEQFEAQLSQLVADRKSVEAFTEDVNAKMEAWRQEADVERREWALRATELLADVDNARQIERDIAVRTYELLLSVLQHYTEEPRP